MAVPHPDNTSSGCCRSEDCMQRRRLLVEGCVQGVGFRPFVHDLALRLGLAGHVRNGVEGVLVEVEGSASRLDDFQRCLSDDAPPVARIDGVHARPIPFRGSTSFRIRPSQWDGPVQAAIPPDLATCSACLSELEDRHDRRYGYPFLNCTRCGPRYTIARALPYDRQRTTMADFAMCTECLREYEAPEDRRFHAQPTACRVCGPALALLGPDGSRVRADGDPLEAAVEALLDGEIVAIKGLGGFHLACDARNGATVGRLRKRKGRDAKPFAVMVRSLEAARRLCRLSPSEEEVLTSFRRPIVLAERIGDGGVVEEVAPGLRELGVFLPYTPLHHLLLERVGCPLVMTSGNRSGEPIVHLDGEVGSRLGSVADRILSHDRPIQVPCDDSVVRVMVDKPCVLRRSRGYVPESIPLPRSSSEPVLAMGGHLKSTTCLVAGHRAVLSHHVGDLDTVEARAGHEQAARHLEELYRVRAEVVAHDLHPDYASTRMALARPGVRRIAVQHHHAHVVSCMVEHGEENAVIGVAFDGTGWGTDGAVWGGEFLQCTWREFRRLGHLAYRPLPGGEAAVREPWRMAVAHMREAVPGEEARRITDRLFGRIPRARRRVVEQMLRTGSSTPLTSSVGRLFDAAAAILDVRPVEVAFEAQAAMELEAMADTEAVEPLPVELREGPDGDGSGPWVWDPSTSFRSLLEGLDRGIPRERLAGAFHLAVADAVVKGCRRARDETGIGGVVLTGGVFQNRLLLERTAADLREEGFRVLLHGHVPPNDGGLSLGQAAVAMARLEEDAASAREGAGQPAAAAASGGGR